MFALNLLITKVFTPSFEAKLSKFHLLTIHRADRRLASNRVRKLEVKSRLDSNAYSTKLPSEELLATYYRRATATIRGATIAEELLFHELSQTKGGRLGEEIKEERDSPSMS